ncbi:MAG: protein kinase [Planctomycetota bacterium]
MTNDPQQADEIFEAAIAISDAKQRESYISCACAGDAGKVRFVRRLVDAHRSSGGFMNTNAASELVTGEDTNRIANNDATLHQDGGLASNLGAYELVEELGAGGMAVVYLARQKSPERFVAVKHLRSGMAEQATARLTLERQILAKMDHPGIAKVFDAGFCEKHRPYYVMEYVEGCPIDQFLANRQLTLQERVQLTLLISETLEHAHQHGIIHRDIKPANILVTEVETPEGSALRIKVIDFGIAKLFDHESNDPTLTRLGQILGTPRYMSPEQVQQDGCHDTRTDIYSLGAVLYELLTGDALIPQGGLLETIRRIADNDPVPPKTRSKQIDADLSNICMKCLKKSPEQRYQSARELSQDLRSYLHGHPVSARPLSRLGHLQKWTRRAPWSATASAAAVLAFVAFVVSMSTFTWHLTRQQEIILAKQDQLEQEKQNAFSSFQRAHKAARNYLTSFKLHTPLGSKKNLAFQRDMIGKGIRFYDELLQDDSLQNGVYAEEEYWALLRKERAELYLEIGKVHLKDGEPQQSLDSFSFAIAELQEISSLGSSYSLAALKLQAIGQTSISRTYQQQGMNEKAIEFSRSAITTYQQLLNQGAITPSYANWYQAITWFRIASVHRTQEDWNAAESALLKAEEHCQSLPMIADFQLTLAQTLRLQSCVKQQLGKPKAAIEYAFLAREKIQNVVKHHVPTLPRYEAFLARATFHEAEVLLHNQQRQAGLERITEAIELQTKLARRLPEVEEYTEQLRECLLSAKEITTTDENDSAEEEQIAQRIQSRISQLLQQIDAGDFDSPVQQNLQLAGIRAETSITEND